MFEKLKGSCLFGERLWLGEAVSDWLTLIWNSFRSSSAFFKARDIPVLSSWLILMLGVSIMSGWRGSKGGWCLWIPLLLRSREAFGEGVPPPSYLPEKGLETELLSLSRDDLLFEGTSWDATTLVTFNDCLSLSIWAWYYSMIVYWRILSFENRSRSYCFSFLMSWIEVKFLASYTWNQTCFLLIADFINIREEVSDWKSGLVALPYARLSDPS